MMTVFWSLQIKVATPRGGTTTRGDRCGYLNCWGPLWRRHAPAPSPVAAPGLVVLPGVSDHHGRLATATALPPRAMARYTDGSTGGHIPSEYLGIQCDMNKSTPKSPHPEGRDISLLSNRQLKKPPPMSIAGEGQADRRGSQKLHGPETSTHRQNWRSMMRREHQWAGEEPGLWHTSQAWRFFRLGRN